MSIWRGDTIQLGDWTAIRADIAEHGCRWYHFIGGPCCDQCGKSIREHEGDLTIDRTKGPFDSKSWIAKPFTWSTIPVAEPAPDAVAWIEHLS